MEKHKKVVLGVLGGVGLVALAIYVGVSSFCRLELSYTTDVGEFICDTDIPLALLWVLGAFAFTLVPNIFARRKTFLVWICFASVGVSILIGLVVYAYGPGRIDSFMLDYTSLGLGFFGLLYILISYLIMFFMWWWGSKQNI